MLLLLSLPGLTVADSVPVAKALALPGMRELLPPGTFADPSTDLAVAPAGAENGEAPPPRAMRALAIRERDDPGAAMVVAVVVAGSLPASGKTSPVPGIRVIAARQEGKRMVHRVTLEEAEARAESLRGRSGR